MEIALVRQHVRASLERARKREADRRTRTDEASREYDAFLERTAVPLFRQVANALKADGYPFTVFTPGGSVRLMSDRAAEDYVELVLDTSGARPAVVCHSSRARGRRVVESERALGEGPIRDITEEQLLRVLLEEVEEIVSR